MKIHLQIWLWIAVTLSGVLPMSAYDFQTDGIYYGLNGEEATVVQGDTPYSGDVVVPLSVSYDGNTYSVTAIGETAFESCSELISIALPNTVTTIGYAAFYNCSSLASVSMGNSVTSIGVHAFFLCSSLASITLPASVISIGTDAFLDCENLEEIIVAEGNNSYSSVDGVLYDKNKTTLLKCPDKKSQVTIPTSVTAIENGAFTGCHGLTTIEIPNSVKSISSQAFFSCRNLTTVSIGNSVTAIGNGAFSNCTSLEEIIVAEENPSYSSVEGALYNKDQTVLSKWPDKKLNVSIPNSVTAIGNCAFEYCSELTSITLPESVTTIGEWAFSRCSGLTSIDIPHAVKNIGYQAFSYCDNLTSISIGNSVIVIGDYAFENCNRLTLVAMGNSVSAIGNYAFSGCSSLSSITLPASVTRIGANAFWGCNMQKIYSWPQNPPEIAFNTFTPAQYGATLYIPTDCKSKYEADPYWHYFMNMVEIQSSVDEIDRQELHIYVVDCTLHVENDGAAYRVYSASGKAVYAGNAATLSLAPGVYVVCTENDVQKVLVK